MKNLYYCILFCLFGKFILYSQVENNNWYFGASKGLNFATIPPSVISNTNMYIASPGVNKGGSASISDSNGQTLFYSNGLDIYNKLNNLMPNGNFSVGGQTNQPALFIPHPNNPNLYYFFMTRGAFLLCTNCTTNDLPRFSYSVIDKTLNNNNGGIVQKDILLHNFPESSMTIAKTSSGNGYWILNSYKDYFDGNSKFYAIKIDNSGINLPVVSIISNFQISGIYGNGIKVSPDNQKVVIFDKIRGNMKVFSFNSTTGTLNNEIISCTDCSFTSVEFSSDSNLLYTTEEAFTSYVYNLQGTLPLKRVYTNSVYFGLQRAIDGNIYLTKGESAIGNEGNKLYKILDQNSFLNSSVDTNSILLNANAGTNLPQFIPYLQQPECESLTLSSEPNLGLFIYQNKSDITTNNNYVINLATQNITMSAQDFVLLKPNTEIKTGSLFVAKIQPCVDDSPRTFPNNNKADFQKEVGENLKLYPNPNKGDFTIELKNTNSDKILIEVFDLFGKSVFKGNTTEESFRLNLPNLSSGLYLVKVSSNTYNETLKFIKE